MSSPIQLRVTQLRTPIGQMLIVADAEENLRAIDWTDYEARMQRLLRLHYGRDGFDVKRGGIPRGLTQAIDAYFSGDIAATDTVPVQTGGTPFQREVWRALRAIRGGETVSYAQLAHRIGRPTAVRAVGLANGANPIGVVVPCHRVIGSDGSLTGYGGGVERKRWLLEHERRATTNTLQQRRQVGAPGGER